MQNTRFAIIIPTKDRLDELCRLLDSISIQDEKPSQVIIVDGSNVQLEDKIRNMGSLNITYIRKTPPSLTAQRNAGIRALDKDITVAAFLDDDIIMERGSIKNMISFWDGCGEDVGGAAFNLVNEIYRKPSIVERLFFVSGVRTGSVLKSGFQGKVAFVEKNIRADWLVGCAMVFRKKIFDEFMFDEFFSGYARYEDVDFSYRVGKKYKMFIVSDARVRHLNRLEELSFSFPLGRMEVINRIYFVRKNKELSLGLCCWALFGIFINNMVKGIFTMNSRYINRAFGNAAGFAVSFLRGE